MSKQITNKRLQELEELIRLRNGSTVSVLHTADELRALIAAYRERGRLLGFLARSAEYDFRGNPSNDAAVALEPKS